MVLLQTQRGTFRIAGSLPLALRFTTAPQGFRASAGGGADPLDEARREADDNLVLATGLSVWQSTREVPAWRHATTDRGSTAIGDYDPHSGWRD
jgi:hypothetical protein